MSGIRNMRDIERRNIYDFLQPYKQRIRSVFEREGTAAARRFIYRLYRIRMRGSEIREFLGVERNKGALFAQQVHRLAWDAAGWCGEYAPLGYAPGDCKRTELLAAGLLRKNEKLLIN